MANCFPSKAWYNPKMTATAYSYIRMSTPLQLQGDSLRRQRKLAEEYAAAHDLTLNTDFRLEDIGLSAFDGENKKKGTLGQFLAAVESGKINNGSFLLVESLDRLSRENIRVALAQFLSILASGITIVTLFDNHVYKPDSKDELEIISSLLVMSRAHEESSTKSKRLRSAWAEKRRNAANKKMTARAPAWLRLADDGRSFDLIEERVSIVKRIFDECLAGIGAYSIAKRLNEQHIGCFGRSSHWQPSYVKKILSNEAVVGTLRHVNSGTKEAYVIEDYYPRIIENKVFYNAMYDRKGRKVGGGGRRGNNISNLFSKVAVCGYCGSQMHYINKGNREVYLVCDAYRRGVDDIVSSWPYEAFETSFLAFISEIDLPSYFSAEDDKSKLKIVTDALACAEAKHIELTLRRNNAIELFLSGHKSDFVKAKFQDAEKMVETINSDIEKLKSKRDELLDEPKRLEVCLDALIPLIKKIQDHTTDGIYMLRSKLSQSIKSMIASVEIFSHGSYETPEYCEGESENWAANISDNLKMSLEEARENLKKHRMLEPTHLRHFVVVFKNGNKVTAVPDPKNPTTFLFYQGQRRLYGANAAQSLFGIEVPEGEHVEVATEFGPIASFVDGVRLVHSKKK
jgi:DNA invertase Pin-like site-specific DNA recombinase